MKKLLSTVVLAGTLLSLATPVAASAEPVRETSRVIDDVLGSAKSWSSLSLLGQIHFVLPADASLTIRPGKHH